MLWPWLQSVDYRPGCGVCGVAETPVVICRLRPWHVVCFRLCLIFMPQLCPALMSTLASAHSRSECWLKRRCYRCSHRSFSKFHIIIHSRTFAFMATVADGAVRLPVGLLDLYMHKYNFQKKWRKQKPQSIKCGQYHHSCTNKLAAATILDFIQSASSLVCLSLGDIGKLQKLGKLQNWYASSGN